MSRTGLLRRSTARSGRLGRCVVAPVECRIKIQLHRVPFSSGCDHDCGSLGAVASGDGSSVSHTWCMRAARCVARSVASTAFAGFRFPPEVITLAVRWYLRFGLSYRDVEELLAERGVKADHVSIFRWVQRFTPLLAEAARPC